MRTLGAKLGDREFEECRSVIEQLGISQSDYAREAFRLFNSVHHYRRLTEKDYPEKKMVQPDEAGQTKRSEGLGTADSEDSPRRRAQEVPL